LDTKQTPLAENGFNALSYTWGDFTGCRTIIVNDRTFIVRRNLWNFLDVYSRKLWNRTALWIDQICVDQKNVGERNHQIKFMSTIYSTANAVLVWLGEADETSDAALDHLRRYTDKNEAAEEFRYGWANYKSLENVFQRTYWFRLWIVQEILLAQQVWVMCGTRTVGWNCIMLCFQAMRQGQGGRMGPTAPASLQSLILLYDQRQGQPWSEHRRTWRMIDVVDRFASCDCQDPRDKIFGLMALVSEHDTFEIDYRLTVEDLFLVVVERLSCFKKEVVIPFARRLRVSMGLRPLEAYTKSHNANPALFKDLPVEQRSGPNLPLLARNTKSMRPQASKYYDALRDLRLYRKRLLEFEALTESMEEDRERQKELGVLPDHQFYEKLNNNHIALVRGGVTKNREVYHLIRLCEGIGIVPVDHPSINLPKQTQVRRLPDADLRALYYPAAACSIASPLSMEIVPYLRSVKVKARIQRWLKNVQQAEGDQNISQGLGSANTKVKPAHRWEVEATLPYHMKSQAAHKSSGPLSTTYSSSSRPIQVLHTGALFEFAFGLSSNPRHRRYSSPTRPNKGFDHNDFVNLERRYTESVW
jgi:hypothetical protein